MTQEPVKVTITYNAPGQDLTVLIGSWAQGIENDCFVFTYWEDLTDRKLHQFVVPLTSIKHVNIELFEQVECPVGKKFGVSGIGEGVVWSADVFGQRIRFKVKGEKHSTYRVKTLAAVSTESIDTIKEFVDRALSDSRLDQGLDFLREQGLPVDVKSTGDYIRWVIADVFKEEADTIAANGLNEAEVRKRIGSAAAHRFKNRVWTAPATDAA